MNKCVIALSSVNHALKGEKVLKNNGIPNRLIKLQPHRTKNGCAYGLEINNEDLPSALSLFRLYSVPYTETVR